MLYAKRKCLRRKSLKDVTNMDDLLKEIKKLSSFKESDSTSSKDGTTSQQSSAKKIAKKRQKNRHKKNRGRKRRLKYIPEEIEADSSSFTDCTDEDVIKDYIENITGNLSDSDADASLRKGAFLVKRDLSLGYDFRVPWSAEVDETDSFSESLLLSQSNKKRRRYKRHSTNGLDHQLHHITQRHRDRIHDVLAAQFSRQSISQKTFKMATSTEDNLEVNADDDTISIAAQNSPQTNSSSENSDSSKSTSNSPGSEADDEGEESCIESSLSSSLAIQPVIPWWEDTDKMHCDEEKNATLEQSLSLMQRNDFKTRLIKTNGPLLCESGGFVAFANHKIRNFVLHRDSTELSLSVANKKEQHQISQLAALYNLQLTVEVSPRSSKVVLAKTLTTSEADQENLKLFLATEIKLRWRKARAPASMWNPKRRKVTLSHEMANAVQANHELLDVPLPDSNVGNQMLRGMGWMPGQGLGKDNGGITNPVKPVKRPRNLGFGHPGVLS